MADAIQTKLPPDPRFQSVPRNPAHQKDIEDIRRWTRECQIEIRGLVNALNSLTQQVSQLAERVAALE